MPSSTAPIATAPRNASAPPSAAARTDLPARCSTWVCLPPGAMLQVESGRVRLASGPAMCGQMLLARGMPHVLEAGQAWCVPSGGSAAWVQLTNAGPDKACVALAEPPPAPARFAAWTRALAGLPARLAGWRQRARATAAAGAISQA